MKIIQSFTTDRKFKVFVDRDCSNTPTLDAIYTTDYKCINRCESAYYADDTPFYSATKTTIDRKIPD